MRTLLSLTLLLSLVAAPIAGCRVAETSYARWAAQASDSVDTVNAESAFLVAATESTDPTMSAEEAATASAASAETFFRPAGCITATATGRTVVYELDDCTGPYGLVHVTGVVTVDYTLQGDGLGFAASGDDLDINGAVVDVGSQGVYRRVGTAHEITGTISGSGVGPRGHVLSRTGSRTVRWDPSSSCLSVDGTWMTSVDDFEWRTDVSGFERCAYACPAAGGSIEWSSSRGSLRVDYDGSATAGWSTDAGREGTVELWCD